MRMKRHMFRMNCMQIFRSPLFFISIICTVLVCYLGIEPFIDKSGNGSISDFFELLVNLSMTKKLIVLCSAFSYVTSFCNDWSCQFTKPVIIRSGINKYTLSKLITCFTTTFLVSFMGMTLFIVSLSLWYPLFPAGDLAASVFPPFDSLAYSVFPAFYLLIQIAVFSMASATWSTVGLAVSAYIPNGFVAITVPVVASYILEEFTSIFPPFLDLYFITRSSPVLNQGAFVSFLYFTFIFLIISAFAGYIFHNQVRRRIRNEVV